MNIEFRVITENLKLTTQNPKSFIIAANIPFLKSVKLRSIAIHKP